MSLIQANNENDSLDMHWLSSAATHVGHVRQINEDAYISRPDAGLWAVADGMGGHHAGDVASASVINALTDVPITDRLSHYINSVEDRLLGVNQRLRKMAEEHKNHCTIGSTIIAMLAAGNHCAFMWAGDSRAYRYRNNKLERVTRDHSQVEELVTRGLLSPEDAEGHPASNIITRAVGAAADLYVDINMVPVESGDVFLLCSDGLYKHVHDEDMIEMLKQDDLPTVVHNFIEMTLERGATDNVTVIVARAE